MGSWGLGGLPVMRWLGLEMPVDPAFLAGASMRGCELLAHQPRVGQGFGLWLLGTGCSSSKWTAWDSGPRPLCSLTSNSPPMLTSPGVLHSCSLLAPRHKQEGKGTWRAGLRVTDVQAGGLAQCPRRM